MRRILLALPSILFALITFFPLPASASTACYCKYGENHASWDSKDKLYCPGQVYFAGGIDDDFEITADARCRNMCPEQGTTYVDSKTDSGFGSAVNILMGELDHCVFTATPQPTYKAWNGVMDSCFEALNRLAPVCVTSYCFCKYKSGASGPAACVGRTVWSGNVGDPSLCPALCGRLGRDADGPATAYANKCDYRIVDSCGKPLNADKQGCAATLSNAALLSDIVTSRGSVVTLPLPLSNISIPGLIGRVLNAILGIVGAVALLMFVWGGFQWMTAAGNTEQAGKAKKTLVWASLGLIAIFGSYAILSFVISSLS